jgi:hypothetical protein
VLHVASRLTPWNAGLWRAVGGAWIRKTHAQNYKQAWEARLANPALAAVSPHGASEEQREGWFKKAKAWGVNTTYECPPGYDLKLIESNARGWESMDKTVEGANQDITIALAGQSVSTTGATGGFISSDLFKSIRSDLIQSTAQELAYTLNSQCLPAYIAYVYGEEALRTRMVGMAYVTTPPKDLSQEASAIVAASNAITLAQQAAAANGREIDFEVMAERFGIPLKPKSIEATATVTPLRAAPKALPESTEAAA